MLSKVKPYLIPGALVLTLLAVLGLWNHKHQTLTAALRAAEQAQLALRGQIVAKDTEKSDLQDTVKKLTGENDLLREAYELAVKDAPGAKPTATAELRTGPLKVYKAPRPVPAPPVNPPPSPSETQAAPGPAVCILGEGDAASIDVDQIIITTRQGTPLVAGTAKVYREDPFTRELLLAGKFSAPVSDVQSLPPPAPPRWGAEVAGLCTRDGCGLGGGVLLPPGTFLGLRWEARVDAYAGPVLAVGAGLGVRW